MNQSWSGALGRAVREVFESLCFMLPAHPRLSTPPAAPSRLVVAVSFSGAGSGVLQLAVPEGMVAAIAAAMLGEDGHLELEEQYLAVCELCNIVCGNVLPFIAGERAVFDLAPPRVLLARDADWVGAADATAEVLLDEGPVGASIALKSPLELCAS